MSASNQTSDPSGSKFTAIFEVASNEYKTLTGQDLGTHSFAIALEGHNSPDSVLEVFRKQAQAFDKFRKGDDKLMAWLTPIVNILFMFSATLGEGICLVRPHSSYITQRFNDCFLAILSREDNLCRNWCPSLGKATYISLSVLPSNIQLRLQGMLTLTMKHLSTSSSAPRFSSNVSMITQQSLSRQR
jgi:hypothetical protein